MKEILLKIFILIISSSFVISCSGNDINVVSIITCDDGVQNGDETGVDCGGLCTNSCLPENAIEGVIVSVLALNPDKEYILTGPLLIRDGGQLIIRAGTIIKAERGEDVYIAIAQGGKFFVYGREDSPVVITSNAENPAPGDWGGIVICGKAPINSGEVDRSDLLDLFYGGSVTTDSSGLIKYLRVEYSGATYNNSAKFNSISFYGVGSFTTINHVQSYESLGNGFEFIGGTVNTKQLISINSNDNGVNIGDGWNGEGYEWYLSGSLKAGIRIANNKNNESAIPLTEGTVNNVSLIGPHPEGGINYTEGGGDFTFNYIYSSGLNLGINVSGSIASSLIDENNLKINNIQFDNPTSDFTPTNYTGTNTSFYTEANNSGAGNQVLIPDWASSWVKGF